MAGDPTYPRQYHLTQRKPDHEVKGEGDPLWVLSRPPRH